MKMEFRLLKKKAIKNIKKIDTKKALKVDNEAFKTIIKGWEIKDAQRLVSLYRRQDVNLLNGKGNIKKVYIEDKKQMIKY